MCLARRLPVVRIDAKCGSLDYVGSELLIDQEAADSWSIHTNVPT